MFDEMMPRVISYTCICHRYRQRSISFVICSDTELHTDRLKRNTQWKDYIIVWLLAIIGYIIASQYLVKMIRYMT